MRFAREIGGGEKFSIFRYGVLALRVEFFWGFETRSEFRYGSGRSVEWICRSVCKNGIGGRKSISG